jgi:hypothetical protein
MSFRKSNTKKVTPSPTPSQSFSSSAMKIALWPIRISQWCGFFPLSIYKTSTDYIQIKPFTLSAFATILVIIIITCPIFTITWDQERFEEFSTRHKPKGKDTFQIMNIMWSCIIILFPVLSRLDMFFNRKKFISFWDNFSQLIIKFDALEGTEGHEKWGKSLKRKFLCHIAINVITVIIGIFFCYAYTLGFNGRLLVLILGIFQDLSQIVSEMFQIFALDLMIFLIAVYNHCLQLLLEELEKLNGDEEHQESNVENLLHLYKLVDDQVLNFNEFFNHRISIEVTYFFFCLVFYGYFAIMVFKLDQDYMFFSYLYDCLIFLMWFTWLAKASSELAQKSKLFGRNLSYFYVKSVKTLDNKRVFKQVVMNNALYKYMVHYSLKFSDEIDVTYYHKRASCCWMLNLQLGFKNVGIGKFYN